MPTKGKPSDFFIMDYEEGDTTDPTGSQRLPTEEQKLFIYTNYPTFSQPSDMILKLYSLYFMALEIEQAVEREKQAYAKPSQGKQTKKKLVQEEVVVDYNEDTVFDVGA